MHGNDCLGDAISKVFLKKSAILSSIERYNLICFYEQVHEMILASSMSNDYNQVRIGMESI